MLHTVMAFRTTIRQIRHNYSSRWPGGFNGRRSCYEVMLYDGAGG